MIKKNSKSECLTDSLKLETQSDNFYFFKHINLTDTLHIIKIFFCQILSISLIIFFSN